MVCRWQFEPVALGRIKKLGEDGVIGWIGWLERELSGNGIRRRLKRRLEDCVEFESGDLNLYL